MQIARMAMPDERCSPLREPDFISLCHLENGDIPNSSTVHNRAGAKAMLANLNAA